MSRLPAVGKDDGTWGKILNDFLSQSLNTDGSLKTSSVKAAGAVTSVNGHTGNSVRVAKTDVGLSNVTNDTQLKASQLDTDTTLSANSDTSVASQKAIKTYADKGLPGPGIDASKPTAATLRPGATRLSTDINSGTLYTSDGNTWSKAAPGVSESSGGDIQVFRFGGTADTGTVQTISDNVPTDIAGATTSFTFPSDLRNVAIDAHLPLVYMSTMGTVTLNILVSMDNSTWVNVGNGSKMGIGLMALDAHAKLPMPVFDVSTASPNTLVGGSTVYVKLKFTNLFGGTTARGTSLANSTYYTSGDSVTRTNVIYVCKLSYTTAASAVQPENDATHWTALSSSIYECYNVFFGFSDTRIEIGKR